MVRRPFTCGWAWVSSGLGVHRSSALRSSIVFDPAVQRLGDVLSVAGIACSSQTIDSDNSASESFSSARKHTSLVFVLSYLHRESCGGKKRRFTSPALCYLGVGVSTVRLRVLETVGQSHPRGSSTRALKSSYPTALVTASIRLKATESWLPKCRSNSGVLNTRNSQASMSSGSRRVGSRSA